MTIFEKLSTLAEITGQDEMIKACKIIPDEELRLALVVLALAYNKNELHISVQERRLYGVLATLSRSKATQPYIQEPKFHLHEQIGPPCRNV